MPFYANPQINRIQIPTASINVLTGEFSYTHSSPHFIAGWFDASGTANPVSALYSQWTKHIRSVLPTTWPNVCGFDDFYLGGQDAPANPPAFPERIAAGASLPPSTITADCLRQPNTVQNLNFFNMCGAGIPVPIPAADKLFLVIVEYDRQTW